MPTPPVLLIHGYSAESPETAAASIAGIYGNLPARLRAAYGAASVFELDVSRYVTLDDGLTVDDLAFALDRALRAEHQSLLDTGFRVIIHSTGALVIRDWLRRFSPRYVNKPLQRVIYLAGALFGSGWAHIGKGQLAKWARMVFQGGAERGIQVLDALEFGASWTIDLHTYFLEEGHALLDDYGVREAAVIGSEPHQSWFPIPIRYAKEDGSDGVIRVPAGNPNFSYVQIGATDAARNTAWQVVCGAVASHQQGPLIGDIGTFYELKGHRTPGDKGHPISPMAVALRRAHTGETGIVQDVTDQVLDLVRTSLDATDAEWGSVQTAFTAATDTTYAAAAQRNTAPIPIRWIDDSRAQYDRHAQVVFRIRDQDGRPVEHCDIYFNNVDGVRTDAVPFNSLLEDKHVNEVSPNCICFYLRATKWNGTTEWVSQVAAVGNCFLEVTAVEPETDAIQYLPLRVALPTGDLVRWIAPHATTIVDVELLRLPAPELFIIQPVL